MSTENVHGTPPISRENDHAETNINNQPQTMLGSRGPQNEDGSQCAGLSQADGSGDISDQAAAETLMHFHDHLPHGPTRNRVAINGDAIWQQEQMPHGSTGFWQQRTGNSMGVNQQQTVQYTQTSNGNSVQNDNVNMDMNLQNVIVSMSRTLSSIQQKQDSIQQKQDSMQQKQELFEGAFQSVVAVLQEMRSVSLTNSQREASSVPSRPALSNELPQNPQREVVSDGSNVSQPCQRYSSISHVPATFVPRANSSQNSTHDSGQYSTASCHNYVAERLDARPAYRTTNEPVYQESMTVPDARNHTYNMRSEGGESSRHQNHAWQMSGGIGDGINTTTDRTIHRNNRVDDTFYQRDRIYRQEHEMAAEQNADITRAYEGDMVDTTGNRDAGRPVYQQDCRDNQEQNSYQYNDKSFGQRKYSHRPENFRHSDNYGIKFPSFDGKEDWKVWISRFEEIAERRNWDNDMKLDNLLPKLQGRAGDFVFTQLPKDTLKCYPELVKELNSRFRVVETKRTFASKFSQRVQKPNETVEEYAADLKRLYSKAYQQRDAKTRQEDLVRKFLDGLKDNDARFEIEYNKEPEDIDQAVYHAVNFIQTRRRSNQDTYTDKKYKKFARRTIDESYETDEDCQSDSTEIEHVCRVPPKTERPAVKKPARPEGKTDNKQSPIDGPDGSFIVLTETRDLVQNLVTQIANMAIDKQCLSTAQPKPSQPRRGVTCYGCHEQGHIIRDCPRKMSNSEQTGTGNCNRNNNRAKNENTTSPLN